MQKIILRTAVFVLFLSLLTGCSEKLPKRVALNEEQIKKSLTIGRKGKNLNLFEFQKEWRSDLGYRTGSALLFTPFHRLALLSRNAEIQGVSLPSSLIREVLKQNSGIFHFIASLYGDTPNFARNCTASLKCGDKVIKPIFVRNDQYADVNREQTNVATCEYKFSSLEIDPQAKITLIITIPREKGERWSEKKILFFPFDLSKIR